MEYLAKMQHIEVPNLHWYWIVLAIAVIYVLVSSLRLTVWSPLRKVPGPFLASISGLYRLSLVATGKAPSSYQRVHRDYGKIVRVGPNHVSVSDASVIPTIYGLGSKFLKVCNTRRDQYRSLGQINADLNY